MLYIHLFGSLRLFSQVGPVTFKALPRTLPLWIYLLLHRTRSIPRDYLAFLLWPDIPENEARANLRRHLYDLRRALPAPMPGRPWLLRHGDRIQWNPEGDFWLDVAEFERLSTSSEHLAKAVALYSDDLQPDLYEDWILTHRERLRSQYFLDVEELVIWLHARREYKQAIAYIQSALAIDPLHEDLTREAIRITYESGDRPGALQVYQRFAARLKEEVGVEPMQETTELYQWVMDDTALPRLRIARLEARQENHNIPAPLTSFFGRGLDLIVLQDLLISPDAMARLVTLTGPAGCGKTRLALEMAIRLLPEQRRHFPDGIYFTDLSNIMDHRQIPPAIAAVLGLEEKPEQSAQEQLKAYLQDRYILLVLDNFEQVMEAAPSVTDLLHAAPGAQVVVTSRVPLRVYGEHEYPVQPLAFPDQVRLPPAKSLLEYPAVSLFVARARASAPHFTLTEANAPLIAAICAHLDGLPLAIELTAARSDQLSPQALLLRLEQDFGSLESKAHDRHPRHRTLEDTIRWSYDLLDEAERALFRSLGIFAGKFTLQDAREVIFEENHPLPDQNLQAWLMSLADRNMILRLPAPDPGWDTLYTMLVTLRAFARERLKSDEQEMAIRGRYERHYIDLAAQSVQVFYGSQDQEMWIKRLRIQEDNLRDVLASLLEAGASPKRHEAGARMAVHLGLYWKVGGRINEGWDWLSRSLEQADRISTDVHAQLLAMSGGFAQLQGNYALAQTLYEHGKELASGLGNPLLLCAILTGLGTAASRQGIYQEADELLSEAIKLGRGLAGVEASYHLGRALNNLAISAAHLGDASRAQALLEESLGLKRLRGDRLGESSTLSNLGALALQNGELDNAEVYLRQSMMIRKELSFRLGMLQGLSGFGGLALARDELLRATRLLSAFEALHQELGFPVAPYLQEEQAERVATLRDRLGERDFALAWAQGASLSLEQSVETALGSTSAFSLSS